MNVFHGGYEIVGRVFRVYENLVSDRNGFDLCGGVVVKDVGLDPCVGVGLVGCGRGEKLVWHGNGDFDAGVCQSC